MRRLIYWKSPGSACDAVRLVSSIPGFPDGWITGCPPGCPSFGQCADWDLLFPRQLPAHSSRLVNFNAIAEGVVDKKALPRRWRAFFDSHAGRFQPGFQVLQIATTQTKMTQSIRFGALFFNREVQVQSSG